MNRALEWMLNLSPGDLAKGSWRLGFTSEYNNYIKLALLALLVAMIWLTVHCYRREGNSTRPRMRKFLAALRIASIVLVMLILFQPAVIVRITERIYSTVVVLVDDSISMSLTDRYAGADQEARKTALAKRLSISPSELEQRSRGDILEALLSEQGSVLRDLAEHHPVEVMSFSTDQPGRSVYTNMLGSLPRTGPDNGEPGDPADNPDLKALLAKLTLAGHQTDFAQALREPLDRFQGRRIGAIVLLTDGQPTMEDSGARLSAALEYAGPTPRFAVMVGDPTPPKNLAVTGLRAPREIRAKARSTFQAMLTQRNMDNEAVELRLYRRRADESWPADMNTLKPVTTVNTSLEAKEDNGEARQRRATQTVNLTFEPDGNGLGEYVYRVVAQSRPDEQSTEDNVAEAFVKVSDEKIRVLLVSADSGWEFQYIRNYLLRQPELFRVSVWQQNADAETNQSASTGMKISRLPRTLAEMIDAGREPAEGDDTPPGYDVVILYDPAPTQDGFDKAFLELLHTFVTQHRGGLCYIAGNTNTYDVLSGSAAKPLADLLPVIVERNRLDIASLTRETAPRGYPVALTGYGQDHPITRLEAGGKTNRELWGKLPGVFWSQAIAKSKPAARVLAVSSNPDRRTHAGRREPEPLVAVHTAGYGRVAYVGFDETWRWRFVEDGYYFRRFWSNLVRYLAPVNARQVVITTGQDRFDAGEEITIEVEAYDREFKPLDRPTLPVIVTDTKTGDSVTVELPALVAPPQDGEAAPSGTSDASEASETQAGRYRGTILPEHVGTYQVTVDASIAEADRVSAKQFVVELPQAETRRTEANDRLLKRIVSREENFLAAEDIRQLAAVVPHDEIPSTVDYERHTLWDTNAMWILLLVLLATEWILRKRNNLT